MEQIRHAVAPPVEYVPTPHDEQFQLVFRAVKVPGVQAEHVDAFSSEYSPVAHILHAETAPPGEYVPGLHMLQFPLPALRL